VTDTIIQVALAVLGLTSLYLATGRWPVGRYLAPFIGLLGQPFWVWFSIRQDAWGLLVISVAYTFVYLHGCWVSVSQLDVP
jgi:hypothetical protein